MDASLFSLTALLALAPLSLSQDAPARAATPVPVARVHDVSDLTGHGRARNELSLLMDAARTDLLPLLAERVDALRRQESSANDAAGMLVGMVKAWCEPPMQEDHFVDWVQGGNLMVIADPERQVWVERFLALQHAFLGTVDVHCRVLSGPSAELGQLGLTRSFEQQVSTNPESLQLVQRLKEAGAQELIAPRVLALPRQWARVQTGQSSNWVVDVIPKRVEPGPRVILDHEVQVIEEGTSVEVMAVPLPDGSVGIDLKLECSQLDRPVETLELQVDPNHPAVTISLPAQSISSAVTSAKIFPGAVLLVSLGHPDNQSVLVLTLEAALVPSATQR